MDEDFLRLDGLMTLKVSNVNEKEILVDAHGGVRPPRCSNSQCRQPELVNNGTYTVLFRDIPHHGKWTTIRIKRGRTRCKNCGQNDSFQIAAFDDKRNMTGRLVRYIEDNCCDHLFVDVGRYAGLDESTIREVAYEHIERLDASRDVEPPRVLGLDEFYIYDKPSAILTNIGELSVFDVLESRTKPVLKPAIEKILAHKRTDLIVADLFPPYHAMLRGLKPRVLVVADRFHVVRLANYGLDKVRRRIQHDFPPAERKLLKSEAGILDSNSANLGADASERLEYWLSRSKILRKAYETKERFAAVYDYRDRKDAEEAWDAWRRTIPPEIEKEFIHASRALSDFHEEILNYFDYSYTNGYTESANRLVKTINRLGRGYSWRVMRARILNHKPAREKSVKRVSRRVLKSFSNMTKPGDYGGAGLRYSTELTPVEHGPHIPTLIRFLRIAHDYTGPRFEDDDYPDMTPTDFEIEDRERRALIELAELEEDEHNG